MKAIPAYPRESAIGVENVRGVPDGPRVPDRTVMAAAVGVARPAHGRRTSRGDIAAWRRLSPTGRERRAAPSPPPSDRRSREGGRPETVETDSRFRGNDGKGCGNDGSIDRGTCPWLDRGTCPRLDRGACFRESGGMAESWRAEPFAFHPPPGLPPVRGEEKRRRRAAFPFVREGRSVTGAGGVLRISRKPFALPPPRQGEEFKPCGSCGPHPRGCRCPPARPVAWFAKRAAVAQG